MKIYRGFNFHQGGTITTRDAGYGDWCNCPQTPYCHQTLADLMHVVLDPLMRDRVAIAYTRTEGKPEGDEQSVAGIAIWASVSDAVDAKITEQVKAGAFPVRLANEDWVSGDTLWLLDVIAGDRKQATAVLANFRQLSGERPVKVHPIVARSVDPAVLEKMRARAVEGISEPLGSA